MPKHVCIFCGDSRMVVYKQIAIVKVLDIVDRQLRMGMHDPVIIFLQNLVEPLRARVCAQDSEDPSAAPDVRAGAAGAGVAVARTEPDGACGDQASDSGEDGYSDATGDDECEHAQKGKKSPLQSCICCSHWITRRLDLPITILPIQCLLYFVLGINSVESKKCDKRVLARLATTIGEEHGNMWRCIFQKHELAAIERMAKKKRLCVKHKESFCIKREMAAFYHAQNGGGMLLANNNVADLLRASSSRLESPLQTPDL